jgi:hypothetical protein
VATEVVKLVVKVLTAGDHGGEREKERREVRLVAEMRGGGWFFC